MSTCCNASQYYNAINTGFVLYSMLLWSTVKRKVFIYAISHNRPTQYYRRYKYEVHKLKAQANLCTEIGMYCRVYIQYVRKLSFALRMITYPLTCFQARNWFVNFEYFVPNRWIRCNFYGIITTNAVCWKCEQFIYSTETNKVPDFFLLIWLLLVSRTRKTCVKYGVCLQLAKF